MDAGSVDEGSRFKEEQIIGILREQEAGMSTAEVCRKHGISSLTFYKWKVRYGVLSPTPVTSIAVKLANRNLHKQF